MFISKLGAQQGVGISWVGVDLMHYYTHSLFIRIYISTSAHQLQNFIYGMFKTIVLFLSPWSYFLSIVSWLICMVGYHVVVCGNFDISSSSTWVFLSLEIILCTTSYAFKVESFYSILLNFFYSLILFGIYDVQFFVDSES